MAKKEKKPIKKKLQKKFMEHLEEKFKCYMKNFSKEYFSNHDNFDQKDNDEFVRDMFTDFIDEYYKEEFPSIGTVAKWPAQEDIEKIVGHEIGQGAFQYTIDNFVTHIINMDPEEERKKEHFIEYIKELVEEFEKPENENPDIDLKPQ